MQFGETHILLDCGWDLDRGEEQLDALKKSGCLTAVDISVLPSVLCARRACVALALLCSGRVIPDIDIVLISHADMEHMGALPYAVGKLGEWCVTCPRLHDRRLCRSHGKDLLHTPSERDGHSLSL